MRIVEEEIETPAEPNEAPAVEPNVITAEVTMLGVDKPEAVERDTAGDAAQETAEAGEETAAAPVAPDNTPKISGLHFRPGQVFKLAGHTLRVVNISDNLLVLGLTGVRGPKLTRAQKTEARRQEKIAKKAEMADRKAIIQEEIAALAAANKVIDATTTQDTVA